MLPEVTPHVGYVLKRYPRFSETFVVNEILAHEAAGMTIDIFALRPPSDTHFQDAVARVRSAVHYLPYSGVRAADYWSAIEQVAAVLPFTWSRLAIASGEDPIDIYQALCLAREVHVRGIEHLHAHFASSATSVARLAAHLAGIPYSFTAHAKDIFHEGVEPDDLDRKIADADVVVTISDYNLAFLSARVGQQSHLKRIYNGIDLDRFPYASPADREPVVVGVGRLVEKKGFADLIDACAILTRRGRRLRCRIAGAGELESDLRAQIDALGCAGSVELLGPIPQSELIDLVHGAAVLVAPCVVGADGNQDGLPTVLLEAMALGTPCVSTDVTGIPEVLRHNDTGLKAPQRDPHALADAIEQLLDDHTLRIRLAANARRLVETQFDIHLNAARLRDVLFAAQRTSETLLTGVA